MALIEVVRAPFTPEQAASLNGYQASGSFHPYTCGYDDCPGVNGERAPLVAGEGGWHCPACPYAQDWAHATSADGSWRQYEGVTVTVNGGPPVKGELGTVPS